MTDQTTGEAPWEKPGAFQPNAPEPAAREPRQRRKPREAKAESAAPAAPRAPRKPRAAAAEADAPAPRKPRKAKKAKAERAAPETIKVTMREYAAMRVGDDAKTFIKVHGLLAALSKGARAKMLVELGKVLS